MAAISPFQKYFQHQPTDDQQQLFTKLEAFLHDKERWSVFVMRGFAGTGKTTTISALVKTLPGFNFKSVLLAPTGRAAKVISSYSGAKALTIHKKIYRQKKSKDQAASFELIENKHTNTIFIVDEASMISNQKGEDGMLKFGNNGLLNDLITYVYESDTNCRIIFVGDTAQLPPVGLSESPAIDPEFLKRNYDFKVHHFELQQVVRQEQKSGILENATGIRELISNDEYTFPNIITNGYKDIYRMTGDRLEDGLNYAYHKFGMDDTLVVTRSNKNANLYNANIRSRILFREEELSVDDYLMVVRNNYFWLPDESEAGFIANGDIAQVKRIKKVYDMYGFRFADVSLQLTDYPNEPEIVCKLLLNTLMSDSASLSFAENKRLYDAAMEDHKDVKRYHERQKLIKENPFINALQVKFAYAVTCHKAQGGQWKAVFVDQGYLTEEMLNKEFLRWMYTAFSRATEELYLVNFDKRFFSNTQDI